MVLNESRDCCAGEVDRRANVVDQERLKKREDVIQSHTSESAEYSPCLESEPSSETAELCEYVR
jgi:hypothetical protein